MQSRALILCTAIATACAAQRAQPPPPGAIAAMPDLSQGPIVHIGTRVRATLDTAIPATVRPGEPFYATVSESVVDEIGSELVPAGAKLTGRVGDVGDLVDAPLSLEIRSIAFDGTTTPMPARVVAAETSTTAESTDRLLHTWVILVAAASGAVMGTVVVGGVGGALKGSAVGAGATPEEPPPPTLQFVGRELPAGTTIVIETTALFHAPARQ